MKKKIIVSLVLFVAAVFLSGCSAKDQSAGENVSEAEKGSQVSGPCQKGKVALEGYGDPGKRLANCFVEYPGEPSRQDKSYYIVEDICGQFTKEFVENMLGQKIVKIETPKIASLNNCSYYLNDKEYILFNLEYLKIENQKKFYEEFGDKIEKNPAIPMENLVLSQGPKAVKGTIYLVLNPEKFISITPSSENAEKMVNLVDFAAKVAQEIKNYK